MPDVQPESTDPLHGVVTTDIVCMHSRIGRYGVPVEPGNTVRFLPVHRHENAVENRCVSLTTRPDRYLREEPRCRSQALMYKEDVLHVLLEGHSQSVSLVQQLSIPVDQVDESSLNDLLVIALDTVRLLTWVN